MISKNSELYREHPDWAIHVPGRPAHEGRNQYIIDMSRDEIVDYLIDRFTDIFSGANITYIKWDMNRNMTDIYSTALPADRQGEVAHRYILGVYKTHGRAYVKVPRHIVRGLQRRRGQKRSRSVVLYAAELGQRRHRRRGEDVYPIWSEHGLSGKLRMRSRLGRS